MTPIYNNRSTMAYVNVAIYKYRTNYGVQSYKCHLGMVQYSASNKLRRMEHKSVQDKQPGVQQIVYISSALKSVVALLISYGLLAQQVSPPLGRSSNSAQSYIASEMSQTAVD